MPNGTVPSLICSGSSVGSGWMKQPVRPPSMQMCIRDSLCVAHGLSELIDDEERYENIDLVSGSRSDLLGDGCV